MSYQRPCHFFNSPGGCRKGNQCHFQHTNTSNTSNQSPSQGSQPSIGRTDPSSSGMSGQKAPPGICNFYWSTGKCKHEFACRYRHTKSPSSAHEEQVRPFSMPHSSSLDAIAPFLTEDGLARVNGAGTDIYFSPNSAMDLSPTEAHNALKRFLYNDYRFDKTHFIYAFLKPLSSAHTGNTSWVSHHCESLIYYKGTDLDLLL